jgi:4-amino-4-deoxy-L-arabinose transferase-like glycosyltransferase
VSHRAAGRDIARTALIALAARFVVVAAAWNRFPPADDGIFYDTLARRLAGGLGYTWAWPDGAVTPVAHYPVGYPALLAVAYRLLGVHPVSALVLHAVLGAVGAACVHVVAGWGTSRRVGRWAGLAVALHPALLTYTPAIMTEGVCSALLAAPFALALLARGPRRRGAAFLAGLVLGVAVLVRPQSLLLLPLVAALAYAREGARRLIAPVLVVVGVALAVLPWTARNALAFGRPVLVSANGGWNLLIGTDAAANGGWRQLDPPPECREVWDEAAKDACFGRAARERVWADPVAWLRLIPAKLATTFDLGGSGPSYLSRARPDLVPRWAVIGVGAVETVFERAAVLLALLGAGFEPGGRRRVRRAVAVVGGMFLLTWHAWPAYVALVVLLGLGGWRRLTAEPVRAAAGGVLGATLVTHAVFFGAGRYALVAYPWVAALGARAVNFWRLPRHEG